MPQDVYGVIRIDRGVFPLAENGVDASRVEPEQRDEEVPERLPQRSLGSLEDVLGQPLAGSELTQPEVQAGREGAGDGSGAVEAGDGDGGAVHLGALVQRSFRAPESALHGRSCRHLGAR